MRIRPGPLLARPGRKLSKALAPKTPVERASLCTLSVKTDAGFGSGFFISDDGYMRGVHNTLRYVKVAMIWEISLRGNPRTLLIIIAN
ncbi:MAG: hypothetical protein D3906_17940 [Candidatus Electrothrix sp. AUS1_2]|nr:hypothetical protein [Candidatus Electrothrix sp. AUS1_2]